jgi:hypothetical protein
MKTLLKTSLITSLLITTLSSTFVAQGFTIEKHENVPVEKNFVVGPAKIEAEVKAGETKTVQVVIDNKTGRTQIFSLIFEDFVGTNNPDQTVELLGNVKSKTSLKDFLSVEKKEFTLEQGDRAIVPVLVSIPVGTPAGGRFGSVIVSAISKVPSITDSHSTYTGAVVIGRVASLVFVTVPGAINPKGNFVRLATKNNTKVFFTDSVPLRVLFSNTGNVNLNPYGKVEVKNMFGNTVATEIIDPWFVLPDSERTRDVVLKGGMSFGFYKAVAEMNRGYGDIVDEQSVSFVVIPQVSFLGLIFVLVVLFFWIRQRIVAKRENITNHAN